MSDWKYIVIEVGDRKLPIIFPGELVHSDVAEAMERVVEQTAETKAVTSSAGSIPALQVLSTEGQSSTLGLNSRRKDADLINGLPYTGGRPDLTGIADLATTRFAAMLSRKLAGKSSKNTRVINVVSAQVITSRSGTDTVIIHVEKPEPTFPFTSVLAMRFEAAKGTGAAYVREHFDIEPEIV